MKRYFECQNCGHVWRRRGLHAPYSCPVCHVARRYEAITKAEYEAKKFGEAPPVGTAFKCPHCGKAWDTSRTAHTPVRCPKCKNLTRFDKKRRKKT